MNTIVVDASAIGTFLLPDEDGPTSRSVVDIIRASALSAPTHWPLEVMSLIIKAERRRRISSAQRDAAFALAQTLFRSTEVETRVFTGPAYTLATRHDLSAYDAAYLEMAIRLDRPLLTGDRALRRAALALSCPVLP